jgi:murein DD-endopeptidase MepM/ murein hydrolase activator NlpD
MCYNVYGAAPISYPVYLPVKYAGGFSRLKRITILLIISIFFISTCALPVSAIDLKSAKQQKSSIDSQIDKLASDKKKVLTEKAQLESSQKAILKTQAAENAEYKQLLSQIDELDAKLKEISQAVISAQEDYNMQQALFQTRLKVMYENSSTSTLDMMLQSKSIIDFLEKLQYIFLISKNDKTIMEDLNLAKIELDDKKQLQQETMQDIQEKASDKKDHLTSLSTSRAELEERLSKSKAELNKLEAREDELLAKSNALQSTIKNLSKNSRYTGGTMVWPCPSSYSVVSSFGMRRHPILKKYKMHTGIDISASKGVSIVAANNGTVILSSYDRNGYGNYLVVDHGGGITTLYGHASKLLVKVGAKVKAGQVIAKVGMTGLATGNHLHFEVRKDGVPVNPLNGYLSK